MSSSDSDRFVKFLNGRTLFENTHHVTYLHLCTKEGEDCLCIGKENSTRLFVTFLNEDVVFNNQKSGPEYQDMKLVEKNFN